MQNRLFIFHENKKDLAPKTLFRYKQILDSRVLPAMGDLKIEDIKPFHIMQFYGNLQEEGIREDGKKGRLSPATILYHHRLLTNIFNTAVKWQVIFSNPALRVEPPKARKHHAASYEEEDTDSLLTALEEAPLKFRAITYIALGCGLRRGEIAGLEWQDINFDKGTLEVRQAAQYLPGQGIFTKDPKNESSKRIIAVPAEVISVIKQHKKEQAEQRLKMGDAWQGSNRLFTTWTGKPIHPDTISQWFPGFIRSYNAKEAFDFEISAVRNKLSAQKLAVLEKLREQYLKFTTTKVKSLKEKMTSVESAITEIIGQEGLERIRQGQKLPPLSFHGIRHTAASYMIKQGIPIKNIATRLGHSSPNTTLNIYAHSFKSVDEEAANKMNDVFITQKNRDKQAK